jgi:hypothetical protein
MAGDLKSIKERAARIGLPHRVWAKLSSTPESTIYQPNLSNWLDGTKTSESKVKRLMAVLESVEDLVNNTSLRLNLSDAANVTAALKKLEADRELVSRVTEVGWTPRAAAVRFENLTEGSLDAVKTILATPLEASLEK